MAKKETPATIQKERQEVLKGMLPAVIRDEARAEVGYNQKAAIFPENRAMFKRLAKQERAHKQELTRVAESSKGSSKPPKR